MTKTKVVQINEIAKEINDVSVSEIDEQIYKIVYIITQERKRKNISQKQLSSLTELPQNTISRIETFVSTPSLPVLLKILSALDMEFSIVEKND